MSSGNGSGVTGVRTYLVGEAHEMSVSLYHPPNQHDRIVWSTHPSYFTADAGTGRLSIFNAMDAGPQGLATFFSANGVDPHFRFVRIKGSEPAPAECSHLQNMEVDRLGVYRNSSREVKFSDLDKFELVYFENQGGVWNPRVQDLSWQEAFAFGVFNERDWLAVSIAGVNMCSLGKDIDIWSVWKRPWIQGVDAADFAHAFYQVLLPSIDSQKRIAVRMAVEEVLKRAGTLYFSAGGGANQPAPVAALDSETSLLVRDALNKNYERLSAQRKDIYARLSHWHQVAAALPTEESQYNIPPLPDLPNIADIAPDDFLGIFDGIWQHAMYKLSPSGEPESVRRFIENELEPFLDELNRWVRDYTVVGASWENLHHSSGPIQFAATGGFLPQSGETIIDLPTLPKEGGVELDLLAIGSSLRTNDMTRDWDAVVRHWRVTGKFSIRLPHLMGGKVLGNIDFGGAPVAVRLESSLSGKAKAGEVLPLLQGAVSHIEGNKNFGKPYLRALAQRGVREVVLAPSSFLAGRMASQASVLARQGAALIEKDEKKAIALLKAAAVKFSYVPGGLYDPSEKKIYLAYGDNFSWQVFLHELAHADEAIRKQVGILDPATLMEVDVLQNKLISSGDETVSTHPEVRAASFSGAEERRADGLATLWFDESRLKSTDPDLFNYFLVIARTFNSRRLPPTDEEEKIVIGQQLKPLPQFSPLAGNLISWTVNHPNISIGLFLGMAEAGDENDFADPSGTLILRERKRIADQKQHEEKERRAWEEKMKSYSR